MPGSEKTGLAEYLAAVVMLLMAVGAVFVFSAGANVSQELDFSRFYEFQPLRQIVFFPLAVLVMHAASRFDYHWLGLTRGWLRSVSPYLLFVSIALLAVVLLPGVGIEVNRARRWLRIPAGPLSISFQPSELAKWAVVFFLAAYCSRHGNGMKQYFRRFVPACLLVGVVVALIVTEDFGTAAFVALLSFVMLVIGGARWWHVLTPVPLGAVGFCGALVRSPARLQRIAAFLNPEKWASTTAYQADQSLIALSSGGFFGKGLGRGICKYGHLPEDTTDFILAVLGEELGFLGVAVVIGLFISFVWLGMLVVVRCREHLGQLLAAGIVLTIGIQAAINIGVATVVLPTKGIPLPFVSAGGTGMLLSAAAVGLLINIARQCTCSLSGDRS